MGVHYVLLKIVLIKKNVEFGLDTTCSIKKTRKTRSVGQKEIYTLFFFPYLMMGKGLQRVGGGFLATPNSNGRKNGNVSENASKHTVGRGLFSNLMRTKIGTSGSLQCSPLLNEKQLLLEVGNNGGTWLVNE
jgi:hypothetical protein